MQRILANILLLHWAATFALLAGLCVLGAEAGVFRAMDVLGLDTEGLGLQAAPTMTALISLAFAVCAVLFFWALLTGLMPVERRDHDDVQQMAFGAAALSVSVLLLAGMALSIPGLFPVAATHLAALLASYVAIRVGTVPAGREAGPRTLPKLRASEASRVTSLGQRAANMARMTGEGL